MKRGVEGVLHLLGVARRSGRVLSGDRAVLAACMAGQARAILLATDASENTRRRFRNAALRVGAELYELGDKNRLGEALGQSPRAVIAVTDAGFARAIAERLGSDQGAGGRERIQDRRQE